MIDTPHPLDSPSHKICPKSYQPLALSCEGLSMIINFGGVRALCMPYAVPTINTVTSPHHTLFSSSSLLLSPPLSMCLLFSQKDFTYGSDFLRANLYAPRKKKIGENIQNRQLLAKVY